MIKNNKSFNQMLQFQWYSAVPDEWRWILLPICFVQSNIRATFLGRFTDVMWCVAAFQTKRWVFLFFFLSSESDFPLKDFLRLPDPPPLPLLPPWEMSDMQAVKCSIQKKMTTHTVPCMCDCHYMFQGVCCTSVFIEGHSLCWRAPALSKNFTVVWLSFMWEGDFAWCIFWQKKKITTKVSADLSEHMQYAVWGFSHIFLSYTLDRSVAADDSMCN